MLRTTLLVLIALSICTTLVFAEEMVAIKGLSGSGLGFSRDDTENLFKYFKYLGYGQNGTFAHEEYGLGVTIQVGRNPHTEPGYILTHTGFIASDRRFATSKNLPPFTTTGRYFSVENDCFWVVDKQYRYYEIGSVFLHKRDQQSYLQNWNRADQSPIVYRDQNRSYTFMHEGSLSLYQYQLLLDYYSLRPDLVDDEINDLIAT